MTTNTNITIQVSILPSILRSVLSEVRYRKREIALHLSTDSVDVSDAGSQGLRAFAALVGNAFIPTDRPAKVAWGSFGGPNMFTVGNPIDTLGTRWAIPTDGAIILGNSGGYAFICVGALTLTRLLAPLSADVAATSVVAGDASVEMRTDTVEALALEAVKSAKGPDDLSDLDRRLLYCYGAVKAGTYRSEAIERIAAGDHRTAPVGRAAVNASIESLVTRGYLKRAANGATQITPKGKNTRSRQAGAGEVW